MADLLGKPRKIQSVNQLTSISFGTDNPKWISVNAARERSVESAWGGGRDYDPAKLAAQKQALQNSYLALGDSRSDYSTSATLRDPTGKMSSFRGKMAVEEARQLRKSHIELGTAATRYQSTAHSQNVWASSHSTWNSSRRSTNGPQVDFEARKRDARKVNFKLGDSRTEYTSLTKSSFRNPEATRAQNKGWKPPTKPEPKKSYEDSSEAEQTEMLLDDLRGAHFSLGTDRSNFRTSNDEMNSKIMNAKLGQTEEEMAVTIERKKSLVRSNLCLGSDYSPYVSTARAQQMNHPLWQASDSWEDRRGGRKHGRTILGNQQDQ